MFRIGNGFDVHPFEAGKKLILGGIEIPHTHGMSAHTDGDVVLHAIMDALLGALALGDLGHFFRDEDESLKNAPSSLLLKKIIALMNNQNYEIVNIDTTIIAQQPKMAPHIQSMRETIASLLQIEITCVSVKATTTDHLGAIGRQEGIAVLSTILLKSLK
ncbi:MAG: 2-C-methyl-D-erythritol 2,4-cyclodiphosphate synthase [Legionellales bacterium]|nr:2-C-methyl-D-erythritol 2,4-cyclodiphosphate synthase [Legionellales bacterium]